MAADKAEMGRKKRALWERKWKRLDIVKAFASLFVHFLCLLAPFNFTWPALRVALIVYTVGGLGITVSYHRNLAHRSFKVPKWLEYFFAYCGLLAIQVRALLFHFFLPQNFQPCIAIFSLFHAYSTNVQQIFRFELVGAHFSLEWLRPSSIFIPLDLVTI